MLSPSAKKAFPKLNYNQTIDLKETVGISLPFLPWEIIDEILIHVRDAKLAVVLERFSIALKIDPEVNFNWAIQHGMLDYLKYLNARKFV